jgi:hypothetical protein
MNTLGALLSWALAFQDPTAPLPEPDAALQKETLKQIKDLFKADYAKKAPADQEALAQKLLQKGVETGDDPASKFVFLKEAREVAVAAGDVETAIRAAEEVSRAFAVDGPALKLGVVTKMAPAVRDAGAARTLAKSCVALADEAVRADGYEIATSALAKAEILARTAQDAALIGRLAELKKDVASLKEEYGRVKPMLDKPATADAEAVGRYLCFVKDDWAAGMPQLASGAKGPLKAIVEKDALKPAEAVKRVELAQAWAELAKKEKSAWRRRRLQTRVRYWLELAQADATGVLKLSVEKQLAELEETEPGTVNLLRLVDAKADAVGGEWTVENGALISGKEEWARLQLPYTPPDEYDLTLVAERREGSDVLGIGLGQGKSVFAVWVDGFPAKGGLTALDSLDGLLVENSPAAVKGTHLANNKPSTIVIAVRKSGVKVDIDGKGVLSWSGNYSRLSRSPVWQPRDPKAPLLVGAFGSRYHFSKILLTPVSGQGKPLR